MLLLQRLPSPFGPNSFRAASCTESHKIHKVYTGSCCSKSILILSLRVKNRAVSSYSAFLSPIHFCIAQNLGVMNPVKGHYSHLQFQTGFILDPIVGQLGNKCSDELSKESLQTERAQESRQTHTKICSFISKPMFLKSYPEISLLIPMSWNSVRSLFF